MILQEFDFQFIVNNHENSIHTINACFFEKQNIKKTLVMIERSELMILGFNFLGKKPIEDEGFYEEYRLNINDSYISVIFETLLENEVYYIELNGEELQGRTIKIEDLKILKEIL